eukprot:7388086-Prymnesium_polylepis.3
MPFGAATRNRAQHEHLRVGIRRRVAARSHVEFGACPRDGIKPLVAGRSKRRGALERAVQPRRASEGAVRRVRVVVHKGPHRLEQCRAVGGARCGVVLLPDARAAREDHRLLVGVDLQQRQRNHTP